MDYIERLSKYITEFELESLPVNVIESSKVCVLDSFGVAVGASKDSLIENIVKEYRRIYSSQGNSNVWGYGCKMPFLQAAFLNALMGHRLELDDVHTNSKTHIGTVVVPAAVALSQYLNSTGREFLEAVICGYEVMSRIGMGLGVSSHRNKGWHSTSTAGTFGAAAAASKLMKLDLKQTAYALGMAGTQSFGVWAFLEDSASSKILHPARAAASGIEAALLSKAGMTGPVSILDAKDGGLFQAMSDEFDLSLVIKDLNEEYEILKVDNKPYPCCRSTHCAIDSALYIRENYDFEIEEIDRIEIETYLVGYKQCGVTEGSINPKTSVDAKFSTPYTFSTALINGEVTIKSFLEDNIKDFGIQKFLKKVKVKPSEIFTSRYPKHWGCQTKVFMKSGECYNIEIKDALGSVDNPVSGENIRKKIQPLLEIAYEEKASDIIELMMNIEKCENLNSIF
jgi:2-methylcitrate dehydratase PrpD